MAWDAIDSGEIEVGDPITAELMTKIKDNLDYLYGQAGSTVGIPNGSFEVDSDADGVPDSWAASTYTGGTCAIESTSPAHGAKAVKMVHPGGAGNGGGYYESEYIECAAAPGEWLSFYHWATAAGMNNQVIIRYFNDAKVDLSSDQTIYSSTSNPTSANLFLRYIDTPATARFYKVRLIGGHTDTDIAGTAYFDGVSKAPSAPSLYHIDFDIAAQSGAATTWTDVGSATLDIPIDYDEMATFGLSFCAELKTTTGGSGACMRFRVGSTYSNEINDQSDLSYTEHAFLISGAPASAISSGQVTVYMQLMRSSAYTTYGRKADSHSNYTIGG